MYKSWEITVDLKLKRSNTASWSNVFQFTADNKAHYVAGNRVPSVFQHPYSKGALVLKLFKTLYEHLKLSTKLHICSFVNDDWNYQFNTEDLTEDWFNLKIKQVENSGSYEYSILIDDKQVLSKENKTPKVWNNVQAEFGRIKDVSGFRIAKGSYRNLRVTSKYLILQTSPFGLIQLDNDSSSATMLLYYQSLIIKLFNKD